MGNSYGFFDCRYDKGEIEAYLDSIIEVAAISRDYHFKIQDSSEALGNPDLFTAASHRRPSFSFKAPDDKIQKMQTELQQSLERISVSRTSDLKYMIHGKNSGASNLDTAKQVRALLGYMGNTPLFREGEIFFKEIFFEKDGVYIPLSEETGSLIHPRRRRC
jgi:hypothetical protein